MKNKKQVKKLNIHIANATPIKEMGFRLNSEKIKKGKKELEAMRVNQKEIDMIVEETRRLTRFHGAEGCIPDHDYEALAEIILSKLHKDEIVLARSRLEFDEFSTSHFMVDDIEFYTDPKQVSELKKLEGKTVIIKAVIEDE